MRKKGQTTLFIILGIVIVMIVALFFYLRSQLIIGPVNVEDLRSEMENVKEYVSECVEEISEEPIIMIGKQGGYLNPTSYRMYNDSRVSYLCYNIKNKDTCYNKMLQLKDIEEQLTQKIQYDIKKCNVRKFQSSLKGYNVLATKEPKVDVVIGKESVVVEVDYPIILRSKKTETEVKIDKFVANLKYPLGELYEVSQTIIDTETQFGDFDPLIYMLAKKGLYKVYKHRPYPDKIYILKTDDNEYIFQFFVQGEPS